jgi:hypothetical protein
MRAIRWGVVVVVLLGLWSGAAAAEQPEVLLGVSMDFDRGQITLEVVSSGCTKQEDFRFEFSSNVLTMIRKERDSCKAMPTKVGFTYPLKKIGINPNAPFRIGNAFIANERLAK